MSKWASRLVLPCIACSVLGLMAGGLPAAQSALPKSCCDDCRASAEAMTAGRSAMITGPIALNLGRRMGPGDSKDLKQEAIYYIDYRAGRLFANVPEQRQTIEGTRLLGAFAHRDLIRDFRLEPGVTPHFEMRVGQIGDRTGWAPLFVAETTTRQVAAYRVQSAGSTLAGDLPPKFELLEVRRLP